MEIPGSMDIYKPQKTQQINKNPKMEVLDGLKHKPLESHRRGPGVRGLVRPQTNEPNGPFVFIMEQSICTGFDVL